MSAFFDTNILVYAFLDTARRARALEIIAGGGIISTQVLNEFTNVARKNRQREWAEIESALATIAGHFQDVRPLTADTHSAAVALARDHHLAFYDALIVAAAIEAGCDVLYSEDMQHGRAFDGLTIRNPFRETSP